MTAIYRVDRALSSISVSFSGVSEGYWFVSELLVRE